MKLLLEKGAEVEAKSAFGQTPLSWAARGGHEGVVKLLLEIGAELEAVDNDGQTPLSWAAENGHEAVVKLLLEEGAELETKDKDSQTPLSWAAKNGYEAVVKLLLEKGADLETKNRHGQTPLSRASEEDWDGVKVSRAPGYARKVVVKLLLEKGAELETKKKDGQTPLSRPSQEAWGEGVKVSRAPRYARNAVVKQRLEKGAELETKDKDGQTPLSRAAEKGRSLSFDAIGTVTNNPFRGGRVRRGSGFRAFQLRTTLLSVCTYNLGFNFSGPHGKGPGLFWEKDWGSIRSESYCQRIVPILAQYYDRTRLVLTQDNAKGHAAKATLQYMMEHNIIPIFGQLILLICIESRLYRTRLRNIFRRNILIFIGLTHG